MVIRVTERYCVSRQFRMFGLVSPCFSGDVRLVRKRRSRCVSLVFVSVRSAITCACAERAKVSSSQLVARQRMTSHSRHVPPSISSRLATPMILQFSPLPPRTYSPFLKGLKTSSLYCLSQLASVRNSKKKKRKKLASR